MVELFKDAFITFIFLPLLHTKQSSRQTNMQKRILLSIFLLSTKLSLMEMAHIKQ